MPTSVPSSSGSPSAEGRLIVLIGPGGTGKGTVAARLLAADEHLKLSKSWTTRAPREGEPRDAYVFVDRPRFEEEAARGGFLEWAEFLGNLYGSPVPDLSDGRDVLLEIEVQGARQVLEREPRAVVILLSPPSEAVQAARLRGRGDDEAHVASRIEKGRQELEEGRQIASYEVVNDDLEQSVVELLGILASLRSSAAPASHKELH